MKHIKMYESFEDFYVIAEEYDNIKTVPFEKDEVEIITNFIKDCINNKDIKNMEVLFLPDDRKNITFRSLDMISVKKNVIKRKIGRSYSKTSDEFMYIYRLPDEWFFVSLYVNSQGKYYKCDQMEGLIKLIEHLI